MPPEHVGSMRRAYFPRMLVQSPQACFVSEGCTRRSGSRNTRSSRWSRHGQTSRHGRPRSPQCWMISVSPRDTAGDMPLFVENLTIHGFKGRLLGTFDGAHDIQGWKPWARFISGAATLDSRSYILERLLQGATRGLSQCHRGLVCTQLISSRLHGSELVRRRDPGNSTHGLSQRLQVCLCVSLAS